MSRRRWISVSLVATALATIATVATAGGRARSVLYPRPARVLRFSHRGAHAKLRCQRCHTGVERSISANDRHVPREASCRACHAKTTRRIELERMPKAPSRVAQCATCHVGYQGMSSPARLRLPAARLRFSHRLHADKNKIGRAHV